MSMLRKAILIPALALALLAQSAYAQKAKPVLVVSVSGVKNLFDDVEYLAGAAGASEYANLMKLMAGPYTAGIDKTKPWGAVVKSDGDEFMPVVFVPVKKLQDVFDALEPQIGKPTDAGDGVWEITDPAPVFVKEHEGFAFLANEAKYLKKLPKDPIALLDGLDKQYDIAARAYLSNVSQEHKDWAIDQMKDQNRRALERQKRDKGEDDPEYQLAVRLSETQIQRLSDLINDGETVTVGWSTDGMAKKTFFEFSMSAAEGTPTAKRIAL
ncbi:MAG: hypothetical protein KDA41_12440, partial [Planctomycetales bacterium]|nr:hypothetical protein [Planctomycetales bacterium]